MSPEQFTSEEIDGRSDVYSLALVVYEMLAGANPLGGSSAPEMLARRFTGEVPSLRESREVPEAVDSAIRKSLARTPADRYATAADLVNALRGGLSPTGETTRRPLHRNRIAGVVVGLAATAALHIQCTVVDGALIRDGLGSACRGIPVRRACRRSFCIPRRRPGRPDEPESRRRRRPAHRGSRAQS